jgi:xanthine/uracil permease
MKMLKKVFGVMVLFAVVMILGGGLISMAISSILGGGIAESFIYPIYGGIILLAGLVVGCTCVLLKKLNEIEIKISSGVAGEPYEK